MCGFVACLRLDGSPVDVTQVIHMIAMLKHRGPDSTGLWHNDRLAFAFQRLSIQDLTEASNQPMSSADGRYKIVFNGEIYNFKELRCELQSLGYSFQTTGDTEVLLSAYIAWGRDCLAKLNGMWAFLIYDTVNRELFGSRDRFGIKPLFMYRCKEQLQFASEIKAIRSSSFYRGEVNWNIAAEFLLRQRLDFDQRTFFTKIEKIRPGTAFSVDANGDMSSWSYWNLPLLDNTHKDSPYEEYFSLFSDAVNLQLRSDVPVGVYLSGGLDSTSIICEVARLNWQRQISQPTHAFSFMHEEFDESGFIKDTLLKVNAVHRICTSEPLKLWDGIPEALWYQDEPVHSINAVIGFELSKLAAESGIKVVLNGQGADETTGGYSSYFANYWHSLLYEGSILKAWHEIGQYTSMFGGSQSRSFLSTVTTALRAEFRRSRHYRRLAGWRQRKRLLENDWFLPGFKEELGHQDAQYVDLSLDAQLRDSVAVDPLPLWLRIEDRNTMAHGVEARLPFLDYRLVSFLFSCRYDLKIRGFWNKHILRAAMTERIPSSVCERHEKMGFPVPIRTWFAGPLLDVAKQLLLDTRTSQRGIYNVPKIHADILAQRNGHPDISRRLFDVLQFELWMRAVVDGGQRASPGI
jgi:asparagine synthase (glutamine-hydrolysing)